MTAGRLGRGREDRFRQLVGFVQALGQFDSANLAGGLVFLPRRAGNVAAHHALHGDHVGAHHDHGAAAQLVGVLLDLRRVLAHIGGDEVIGHDVLQEVEPEQRNLGQHLSLVWNAGRQNVVESRNAIGGDEQQAVAVQTINVANLAAGVKLEIREFGVQEDGVEKFVGS